MKNNPKAWKYISNDSAVAKLPSGGMIPPYGHNGHFEVTNKVTKEMGFSEKARDILCDAAQDPDFYEFGTVAAHAQTSDNADLCTDSDKRAEIINLGIDDYVNWIAVNMKKCKDVLKNGDVRLSLYWLGYVLHGFQDLPVHQGITNGEHQSKKDNPDYQTEDVDLSHEYTRQVINAVRNVWGQKEYDRLRNYNGKGQLRKGEKCNKDIHPNGWDMDNGLIAYEAAGIKYKTIKPVPVSVRWDRQNVLSRVIAVI